MGMMFCRGCGKEIHESAPTCPQCGAPQGTATATAPAKGKPSYSSYAQVPWYRKNWCAILCALIFTPGLLIILLSGDVYYEDKGQLKTYSKAAKVCLIIWSVLATIGAIANVAGAGSSGGGETP